MYSPQLLDYFRAPRFVGELPPPAIRVRVENPVCGDILQICAEWEGPVLVKAVFKARGCTASIATGSALAEWLRGKTHAEITAFTPEAIEAVLGPLPNESKHAMVLCGDAVKALLSASSS